MTQPRRPLAVGLVGIGGFLGAVFRHAVTVSAPSGAIGTLAVNVVGSFALGLLLSDAVVAGQVSNRTRLFLATGVLSSFTTYSTFALEATTFSPPWALAYVSANIVLGLLAVVAGPLLVRWST